MLAENTIPLFIAAQQSGASRKTVSSVESSVVRPACDFH